MTIAAVNSMAYTALLSDTISRSLENGLAWTLNLPPVATEVEISTKKDTQDSPSMLMRMICQSLGGFWISVN
jgi:hypothetical protein